VSLAGQHHTTAQSTGRRTEVAGHPTGASDGRSS
jgi:hypothetical protein